MAQKAVFIDRDGTLNEECSYLHRAEDCRFVPGAIEAVALLNAAGFLVVVVTNQSGIARGFYSEADLEQLHDYMSRRLQAGGARIDGWYFCPHHPDYPSADDACFCRKPLPGMLQSAAAEMGIDLASSWMIGDKAADIAAGTAAGCRPILVLTGYGSVEQAALAGGITVCDNLYAAALHIIASETKE
jgi:D-glycero-D-manno-heptose 1,7-bisphosphate phosphatase